MSTTTHRFDVFGMCNALFDIQAEVNEDALSQLGFNKGSMQLISEEERRTIIAQIDTGIVNTESGGSGANTMLGLALLGSTACYTSRVGRDHHGRLYRDGLEGKGVKANLGEGEGDTGISVILITPDAERTMCTFLGTARDLEPRDVNLDDLRASRYLYVTGYLWDTDTQKEAVTLAMREANAAGVKVAFSLSDPFCVGRHKDDFYRLVQSHVDVVFANDEEAMALTETECAEDATRALASLSGGLAAVTMNSAGSLLCDGKELVQVPIYPVTPVDTTGAGDMYAAGVLYGLTRGYSLEVTGRIAAYAAAQVVAKLGPRLDCVDHEAVEVIKSEL